MMGATEEVRGQFVQSEFRAADGTAYQLLRAVPPLQRRAEMYRVTTLVGSPTGVGGCSDVGNIAGEQALAVSGVLAGLQELHSFSSVERTAILVPNNITAVSFNAVNAGALTLGTGEGAINVCHVPGDCPDGGTTTPLVPLSAEGGGVPAACIARRVVTACEATAGRDVLAFGLPSTGDPPVCDNPAAVTTNTLLCAPEPVDGFRLGPGQAIVIAYDSSLSGTGFSIGAAGFGIDEDSSNPTGCAAGGVVSASVQIDSSSGPPLPTTTPTSTTTFTPTPTLTPTVTATPTKTPFCGNGIPETPEECDDGNTEGGDCCSATCLYEDPGSPCEDDDNPCSVDQCNSTGTCMHGWLPDGTFCNAGDLCIGGQVCMSGTCTGGAPVTCDDDDLCTLDTCEPSIGCLFEVGIESPECGSCADGIDNDGDGVIDAEEPNCSTLFALQRFAVIGTATAGIRSLYLGREARVIEAEVATAELTNAIRAGACGVDLRASGGTLVTGTVALTRNARFGGTAPGVRIKRQFTNDNGAVTFGHMVPLVGPRICTDYVTRCENSPCPPGHWCQQPLPLNYPGNPFVDSTGTAEDFLECEDSLPAVRINAANIASLAPTRELGVLELGKGEVRTIDLGGGQQVVEIDSLRVSGGARLTISGNEDTVAVIRIPGRFRIGNRVKVSTGGGLRPDRLIWNVEGPGRLVRIASRSIFEGTMIAANRPRIYIGAFTRVKGALAGKRVRMGRMSVVEHAPFVALLDGAIVGITDLAIRRAQLRQSIGQHDNGRVRVTAMVDDNDANTFESALLSNLLTLHVTDGAFFDTTIAITDCVQKSGRVFRCRSRGGFEGSMRAVVKRSREDPRTYELTVARGGLSSAETSTVQPTGPVTAELDQGGGVVRTGKINNCSRNAGFSLFCRAP